MSSNYPLSKIIANRRWLRRNDPFPHVFAQNVFTTTIYEEMETAFQEILSRGLSDSSSENKVMHRLHGYDAYAMSFMGEPSGPFRIFASRAWSELLASLFDVNATGDISVGLHHHCIGSASGSIHHDLNPGWFVDAPNAEGINHLHPLCNYQTGATTAATLSSREVMRAVAMLFYLNNPFWTPGDGGATGLYSNHDDSIDKPVSIIPPINNSMLVFECTPYSYHTFIRNWRHPRNSIIMWLHRQKAEVLERWGDQHIVDW